jgi:hypothetical protein
MIHLKKAEEKMSHELKELIGKDLKGFQIVSMTEVYKTDYDERKTSSLGFFKSQDIAEAFAGLQVDANYHKTSPVLVLTDGAVGYVVEEQKPVNFFDDEAEQLRLREKIADKLTLAERKILGLK